MGATRDTSNHSLFTCFCTILDCVQSCAHVIFFIFPPGCWYWLLWGLLFISTFCYACSLGVHADGWTWPVFRQDQGRPTSYLYPATTLSKLRRRLGAGRAQLRVDLGSSGALPQTSKSQPCVSVQCVRVWVWVWTECAVRRPAHEWKMFVGMAMDLLLEPPPPVFLVCGLLFSLPWEG